ncbi:hypothetical protein BVZ28_13860 [Alcaligenes faecalis]|uniref:Adenylosuccinate synthase n=1 Tax=Alcaligenes faecalis TaxID=511 RepID=A0A1Z3MKW5_ALCFA|nr:hypothetical protein [Alcaligenes faecalis]ASD48440.1 hypothetical protein [Alcaligenes faecalis]OSZ33090.1 hypothetical protein BVZ28_13860 [Alcaligenes faecalis]OSZ41200.1 hypothetical protein BVZ29_13585 [Alcaligenes faecalis]QHS38439.1 adenylosuccinate synthase [Alcaligenes faecalis]RSE57627.1 adenylosuccinate synthase [Alcaligenes faecalis]
MTHQELTLIALKWLKRAQSAGGHGCQVALSECKTGWRGEIPDAIGFRATGHAPTDGSVLVEVKVSRSDFLADAKKTHRQGGGVGRWRYYLAPAGLIRTDELPTKWGLLEVNKRGHVKALAGPALCALGNNQGFRRLLVAFEHEQDLIGENFLLVKALANTGDPQKVLDMLREANNRNALLAKRNDDLRARMERMVINYYRGETQNEGDEEFCKK